MVGRFGLNAHLCQRDADLPADVLALVVGRDVHIAGLVVGLARGAALFVGFEQVKFHFGAEIKGDAGAGGVGRGGSQQRSGIAGQHAAVGMGDGAEHPNDAPLVRPPGQRGQRGGIRMQDEVGAHLAAEAGDGRRVDGDAIIKGARQLGGQDGDVFLPAENIAEGQPDKTDILLFHILHDFLTGVAHGKDLLTRLRTGTGWMKTRSVGKRTARRRGDCRAAGRMTGNMRAPPRGNEKGHGGSPAVLSASDKAYNVRGAGVNCLFAFGKASAGALRYEKAT